MCASLLLCLIFFVAQPRFDLRISDEAREALELLLSEVLPAATELANTRVSKIVLARAEQHALLDLPEFLELFNESWNFVVRCEVMARKMIVGLRGVMVSQVSG